MGAGLSSNSALVVCCAVKCLTEIQNVCMSNGQLDMSWLDMSSDNITRLTYLKACIKETLRLRSFLYKKKFIWREVWRNCSFTKTISCISCDLITSNKCRLDENDSDTDTDFRKHVLGDPFSYLTRSEINMLKIVLFRKSKRFYQRIWFPKSSIFWSTWFEPIGSGLTYSKNDKTLDERAMWDLNSHFPKFQNDFKMRRTKVSGSKIGTVWYMVRSTQNLKENLMMFSFLILFHSDALNVLTISYTDRIAIELPFESFY